MLLLVIVLNKTAAPAVDWACCESVLLTTVDIFVLLFNKFKCECMGVEFCEMTLGQF